MISSGTHENLQYGEDSRQVLDITVPDGEVSKVILLIHGGSWTEGGREKVSSFATYFQEKFPDYAVANMNYRLGNKSDPGNPKQLIDVDTAIKFITGLVGLPQVDCAKEPFAPTVGASPRGLVPPSPSACLERSRAVKGLSFALFGVSAGAHLSMLYSYSMDRDKVVKVIINVVGPTDLTAWDYASSDFFNEMIMNFTGPHYYKENREVYFVSSPKFYIDSTSAKTISFYGENDFWIPFEQGTLLREWLDHAKVTNEFYRYPGGHADWAPQYQQDMKNRMEAFLDKHF